MKDALDAAWRLHDAQMEWTGRVDAKASFILTLDAAAIATGVALSAEGMTFHGIASTWLKVPYGISLTLFVVAAGLAAWAVAPALRFRHLTEEAKVDFIYFGHVRHWDAAELADTLTEQDLLPVLTRQIVRMSEIAWRKHCRAAWSAWLTGAGVVVMSLTGWALS